MRKILLANAQNRDAEIVYGGITKKPAFYYTLPDNSKYQNIKILKSSVQHQYDNLISKYGSNEALAQELIDGDPEIDLKITGKIIRNAQRILLNEDKKPVYKVKVSELFYNPDGSLKEEKDYKERHQNINIEQKPVKWSGKQFPIDEIYNKFIFSKKYQLTHTSGLTFDFLYAMAKELNDKKVMMLVGGGAKGLEPLIFQENGKPYRAFLEGRIKDDSYILLLHISNLELKPIL